MKKKHPIFLFTLLCSALFFGCGEPKNNAASSIKAIYDLYISGDTEGISSLGMSDMEIKEARNTYDESLKETIRANFSASGQEINDDTLEDLCAARKEALSKMTAAAEVLEESDGKATVVIHTTYFNESDLDEDAFYDARQAAQQAGLATIAEQQVYLMDAYTQNLITSYKAVAPSKNTIDITVECVVQNDSWVPANMSSFGSDLAGAITGQDGTLKD